MVAILPTQLEALKRRALDLASDVSSLIQMKSPKNGPINFYEEVEHFEIVLIRWALDRQRGNQTKAARLLGLSPSTLNHMIKRYGITGSEIDPKASGG